MQTFSGILFLCGFMGVGKSTVGLLLAEKLGCAFYDTDLLVTSSTGKTVPEIFSTEGEASFRKKEAEALRSSKIQAPAIVSLGGGILGAEANLQYVLDKGVLIYLAANSKTLGTRLSQTAMTRPLLSGLSENARKTKIESLLLEREAIYRKASLQVETDHKTPEAVVREILNQILKRPPERSS